MYVALFVPYQVAFMDTGDPSDDPDEWIVDPVWWWDRCVDLFFFTDMILVFFTAIKEEKTNTWITDKRVR